MRHFSMKIIMIVILSVFCFVFSTVYGATTTVSPYSCQNGKISLIPCKSGFLGRRSCDNSTLTCEGGKYCCEPASTTKRGATRPSSSSTTSSSIRLSSSTFSSSTASSSCSNCDASTRNECFRSLHIHDNPTLVNACKTCHGCCGDAFPHTCEVWRHKDFCDMEWYSHDKKLILCGKTCGFC